ncbi:hypothetical protein SAY87_006064 [Trapa incisa]|uniref:Uncharacterized protein n=1 Tax=Trapa incisa TaxID=236973 RepID=A0AAN7K6X6_9MYRT|nr:hypothetical protein SAY87_006064 [Trapa incisa]
MEEARLSPETDVVELRDCMEELLKFILQSHTTQTLGLDFDIGLSTDYCSTLLKEVDDFNPSASLSTGHLTGVPPYPLYRRLAMALTETICSGMLCKKYVKALLFDIDKSNLNQNGEFVELIQQKGTELLKV